MPVDRISAYRTYKVRGKSKRFRLQAIETTKKDAEYWKDAFKSEDSAIKVRTKKVGKTYEVYTFFDRGKIRRKSNKRKPGRSK